MSWPELAIVFVFLASGSVGSCFVCCFVVPGRSKVVMFGLLSLSSSTIALWSELHWNRAVENDTTRRACFNQPWTCARCNILIRTQYSATLYYVELAVSCGLDHHCCCGHLQNCGIFLSRVRVSSHSHSLWLSCVHSHHCWWPLWWLRPVVIDLRQLSAVLIHWIA